MFNLYSLTYKMSLNDQIKIQLQFIQAWLYMLKYGWKFTKLEIYQKPLLKIFFTAQVLFSTAMDHTNP